MKIVIGKPKPKDGSAPPPPGASGGGGGFFGSKAPPVPAIDPGIKEEVSTLNRRLKLIEERYTNIRTKSQLMEQNTLQKNKNLFSDVKTINLALSDLKKEIAEIKDKIMIILKESEGFAKKEHVEILRKYIDMWSPVNFVTRNEVDDLVKDAIERMRREASEEKKKPNS